TGRTARRRRARRRLSGLPPLARRHADVALERAAERRFRRVADGIGDFRHARRARAELATGELEAERREVRHGCLADELLETLGEHGARRGRATRELLERPSRLRFTMHTGERAADDGIGEAGEPA